MDMLMIPRELAVFKLGIARGSLHPDRILDHWVLLLPMRGQVSVRIGDTPVRVGRGAFLFLPPGIRHRGDAQIAYTSAWWHFRTGATPTPAYELPMTGQVPAELDPAILHGAALRLHHEAADPWWITAQLHALLSRLCAAHRPERQSPGGQLAREIHAWLAEQAHRTLDRAAIARRFGFSAGHINRVFRALYGTSVGQRHLEIRIAAAADLLREGLAIAEAARRTGFTDYPNFVRRFRQVKGVPPGRFRRQG
jgi:AraC-like DNA-binding protein